jgi:starch synthase
VTKPTRFILMIASEAVPFAKTGGLGDVAGALPLALARQGQRVLLVVPGYRGAAGGERVGERTLTIGGRAFDVGFLSHRLGEGVEAVLVDCPELYDREEIYGTGTRDYTDNAIRYALLSRAALEFVSRYRDRPDVVHAHDWQAGLAPVYLRTLYLAHPVLGGVPSVFTIHNLAYQGLFPPETVPGVDLPWSTYTIDGLEFWGKVSFLKGGINFSEMLTTVSRRYAREIQTDEYGFGFEGVLRRRRRDLVGILSGIDTERWNPATDPFLPAAYKWPDLAGKQLAKRALIEEYGIKPAQAALARPMVAMVSRLVDQKGLDLVAAISGTLMRLDATFVVLGTGDAKHEALWRELAAKHPDRVGARIGFDDRLAHLIEAGADVFLMPSRFEPCGLNQMYSLCYGTVPVVRATGGLDDTVENWNAKTRTGTGFKFREYSGAALLRALRAALAAWHRPGNWRALQQGGMRRDFSWDVSARAYVQVYEQAIRRRPARRA